MPFVDRLLRRASRCRPLVLGAALGVGLFFALSPVEDRRSAHSALIGDVVAAGPAVFVQVAADTKGATATPPADAVQAPSAPPPNVDAEISIGERGVRIRKKGASEEANVVPGDHEFDSFEQFVEKAPWLAALVFMVTALVFLTPLLIIALVIAYKMRSNRMRNETMLKLAERGVVPPAEAIAAMAPGSAPSLATLPSTAPLYEQAKQVRKRVAWSDLRKGVIMGGIGLGLTFWSMLDDGRANGFGLVLLFLGIGYVALWYFEERRLTNPRESGPDTRGGA